MSFLAQPQSPATANRRTIRQAPVSSNVLGTPWPTLWGQRDLAGTVIAWTNHSFSSAGASGKGGGLVSSGEKDFRTFALGLCIGPVDRVTQISYDNQIIWQGNVTIASANTNPAYSNDVGIGGVVLSASDGRGTIAFYFGFVNQGQDPVLARFVPNAPFYNGMCYAVFHGSRTGTQGFRIGNADTLAQIAIRVERIPPAPPGLTWAATQSPDASNPNHQTQPITLTIDTSNFTGSANIMYHLSLFNISGVIYASDAILTGLDTATGRQTITSGAPFSVGSLGIKITAVWGAPGTPPVTAGGTVGYQILISSSTTGAGGANIAGVVYELLTSNVHGIGLDPNLMDLAAFSTAAGQSATVGVAYAGGEGSSERREARTILTDLFQNWQAALCIRNGLIGPVLLIGSSTGTPQWTLQEDDVVALKQRPGAWYELPQHVTLKYRDANRKFRDTVISLPGAGDYGDDDANLEIDLPMITDQSIARLVGSRLRTLQCLPQTPDTITFGRAAFLIQFGDSIAVNAPDYGFDATDTWIVVGVREHGLGDERIDLDLVPDIFGTLPADNNGTGGGGGGGPVPPYQPILPIVTQDAFEFPWDFATDGSRRFTVFAARPEPDAEGFSLYAQIAGGDFNAVDGAAVFSPGGTVTAAGLRGFTMDRDAYFDFDSASNDIDSLTSVSDGDWWGYQMLILVGSGDTATLYAASELLFLGGTTFRVRGLLGPLSDTLTAATPGEHLGADIWFFSLQPPYNVLAQPSWTNGTTVTFKGLPYGSRLSSTLADAIAATVTVNARALRPFPADNLVANGRGVNLNPTYTADIALSWVLRNRGFGFGYETNPSEFDPAIATEIANCGVEVWVGGSLVRTVTVNVRTGTVSTTIAAGSWTPTSFNVASVAGLQPGDRIGIVDSGNVDYFARIASISGTSVSLVSPLPVTPQAGDTVNRYESIGYVYDAATNQADNGGSLASAVLFKVYPNLNGLGSLSAAEITVMKE